MVRKQLPTLHSRVLRATRVHFFLIGAYILATVYFDAWNLITLENVLEHWTLAAVMLIVLTAVWYASRNTIHNETYFKFLMLFLILVDITLATYVVYDERGMASLGVALYSVPIVTSALLYSRRALFATASLCTATYSLASVRYFVVNFNEGYSIQLYGTIIFYSISFFILAALLWIVLTPNHSTD